MIRKRGRHWHYDFSVRGTRYRGAIPEARNKYQAAQAESRVRDKLFNRTYGSEEPAPIAFSKFARDTYLPFSRTNKRSADSDACMVTMLIAYFGETPLHQISEIAVERFKRERVAIVRKGGRRARPSTVNTELSCLSTILSLAHRSRIIARLPEIARLRVDNKRLRYLTTEEEARLFDSLKIDRPYLVAVTMLALYTGMRQGELLALTWDKVDFRRGCIYVTNTKSGRDRAVPLNDEARAVLAGLSRDSSLVLGELPRVTVAFRKACSKAGIEDLKFHDLRHTFATRLADVGVDAFTIQALLGHQSLQMVQRYTHPTEERNRRAVEAISRYGKKVSHVSVTNARAGKKAHGR
jgi:integrase